VSIISIKKIAGYLNHLYDMDISFILISEHIVSQPLFTLSSSNNFVLKSKLYDAQGPLIAAMQNINLFSYENCE
jgi:hypothetical protein